MTTPVRGPNPLRLFYDGGCAFCHWAVRFALRRDRPPGRLRIAPLGGAAFEREVAAPRRRQLADSLAVLTPEGELLSRSAALVYLLRRWGVAWSALAVLLWLVPRPLRDLAYDLFARWRYRLFGRADDACPLLPPELRDRFDP